VLCLIKSSKNVNNKRLSKTKNLQLKAIRMKTITRLMTTLLARVKLSWIKWNNGNRLIQVKKLRSKITSRKYWKSLQLSEITFQTTHLLFLSTTLPILETNWPKWMMKFLKTKQKLCLKRNLRLSERAGPKKFRKLRKRKRSLLQEIHQLQVRAF